MSRFSIFMISLGFIAVPLLFALVFRMPVIIRLMPLIMFGSLMFGTIGMFIAGRSSNKHSESLLNERNEENESV